MAKGTKATTAYRQHMQAKARDTGAKGVKAAVAGNVMIVGGGAMAVLSSGALAAPGLTAAAAGTGLAAYGKGKFSEARGQRVMGAAVERLANRSRNGPSGRLSPAEATRYREESRDYEQHHMQSHAAEPSQGGGDIVVHEHTRRRAAPRNGE